MKSGIYMLPVQLTYGNEGFKEIREFFKHNYHKEVTVEIECEHEDMLDVIMYITNAKYGLMSRFSTS